MLVKDYLSERTDEQLKDELKALNCTINRIQCFSTQDLMLQNRIRLELETRKTLRMMERINDRLEKHFPARNCHHAEVFSKWGEFERVFEQRARQ